MLTHVPDSQVEWLGFANPRIKLVIRNPRLHTFSAIFGIFFEQAHCVNDE